MGRGPAAGAGQRTPQRIVQPSVDVTPLQQGEGEALTKYESVQFAISFPIFPQRVIKTLRPRRPAIPPFQPTGNSMTRTDLSAAPEILTERLRLRAHRLDDLTSCHALWGDINVVRHITRQPATREETWGRLLRYAGHWHMLGFGYWALEDRISGAFVGEAGLADYKRDITPSLADYAEIGWLVSPQWHGRGFATEAVEAILAWSDANLARPCVACLISPDNHPSLRLAERVGMQVWTQTTYRGDAVVLCRRDGGTKEASST
jgi:RimJ/RimL family protein N-acetyltransferase